MTTRVLRVTARMVGFFLLAAAVLSVWQALLQAQTPAGPTTWRLASAQVVTSTINPPMLRLSASGPIAFEVLPADASGEPGGAGRVVARLFGVAPGDLGSSGDLAPFALTAAAAASANGTDTDTLVTIATGMIGSTSDQRLVLRAGMKANEIEAAIVPVQ